jgi:hypothetical protein
MEPYDTAGTIEVDAVVQLNRRFNRRENIPLIQLCSRDLINAEPWNPPA